MFEHELFVLVTVLFVLTFWESSGATLLVSVPNMKDVALYKTRTATQGNLGRYLA
jgi:hypothetical protein